MISTTNYSALPDRQTLRQICKSISVADAILSQDWQYRYYSYNSKWAENEEFCGMRNGEGDEMLILFQQNGCAINGMAHEYYPKDKSNLTRGLPRQYHDFIFGEPVHSIGTTFCLWTDTDGKWTIGKVNDLEDGSEGMMRIFDGKPNTYIEWAADYYEEGFVDDEKTRSVIQDIYDNKMLTRNSVLNLNPSLDDWEQLKSDLREIDFPFDFD